MEWGKHTLDFSKTRIMGILNVTPDSFSDRGKFIDVDKAVAHAKKMVENGADIIDVGGESSRPGSNPIDEKEEIKRIKPVIKKLAKELTVPISIDSYKPRVVEEALAVGASMINDINGLRDERMFAIAVQHQVPVIIMHMQGTPKTMQENPSYGDAVREIKGFFSKQVRDARDAGLQHLILDPGIGFGKKLEHNLHILKRLKEFKELNCPVLIGTSRKSFLGDITGLPVNKRLEATLISNAVAIMNGANIIRVHDIPECKQVVQIVDAIRGA
jgi:dihydropteroate synthase